MKIILIDNYDSFTFNLYHYISSLDVKVDVIRNDKINSKEIIKKKYKFFEVPITYNGRSYEDGKKIGLKDAFIALKTIILYSFKG